MNASDNKKRSILGFTMAELMGVVAIIVILAAVAFPSVFSMQRDLRMRELDDHAQQIYNAVQNRLSAMKASGTAFSPQNPEDENTLYGAMMKAGIARVTEKPSDYNDDAGRPWGDGVELYQLSSIDASSDAIIRGYLFENQATQISSGVLSGSFIIELSPKTGEVYSVYYWEEKDSKAPGGGSVSYDAIKGLRSQGDRKPYFLGYYGGGSLGSYTEKPIPEEPEVLLLDDLETKIVNSEELYLSLKSNDFAALVSDSEKLNSFKIDVTVTGPSCRQWGQNAIWHHVYSPSSVDGDEESHLDISSADNEIGIVLDSMRTGWRFADIVKGILPGTDIGVTVKVYCDRGKKSDKTEPFKTYTGRTNSLYESIDEGAESYIKVAKVSALRHLRNLDLRAACADTGLSANEIKEYTYNFANYNGIQLNKDIDFDGNTWKANPECVSIQSRIETSNNGYNPLTTFEPIVVSEQMEAEPSHILDGGDHTLRNFVVISPKNNSGKFDSSVLTGLFKEIRHGVKDLNMENPYVLGGSCTGALAGKKTIGGDVTNCHVNATSDKITIAGTEYPVGVVGDSASNADKVGGLFGCCACTMTMEDCSSAVSVTGRNYVGGLFGSSITKDGGYVTVERCAVGYSDNSPVAGIAVMGSKEYVGGITGMGTAPINNSQSYVRVVGESHVGGITGMTDDAANNNCTIYGCMVGSEDYQPNIQATKSTASCYVGGITGEQKRFIDNCTVVANVYGSAQDVGGIAGHSHAKISNCMVGNNNSAVATTIVTGEDDRVGGIAGSQRDLIEYCTSVANVHAAKGNVGGITGYAHTGACITRCEVHGRLDENGFCDVPWVWADASSCADHVGGLVGHLSGTNHTVSGCFAEANVKSPDNSNYVGGLIGYSNTSYVDHCYSSGWVEGGTQVGGFVGHRCVNTLWHDNFSTAAVTGHHHEVGGFVGHNGGSDANTVRCASYGPVKCTNTAGVVGGFAGSGVTLTPNYGTFFHTDFRSYNNYTDSRNINIRKDYDDAIAQSFVNNGNHALSQADTHSYKGTNSGAFPFGPIILDDGTALPYYGFWPIKKV